MEKSGKETLTAIKDRQKELQEEYQTWHKKSETGSESIENEEKTKRGSAYQGLRSQNLVEDRTKNSEVWSQPVRSFDEAKQAGKKL